MDIKTINELYTHDLQMGNKTSCCKTAWYAGQLRDGDQCSAIGYAFGLTSFESIRKLFGFKHLAGYDPDPLIGARKQMEMLFNNKVRTPKGVLDVGAGKGDISVALSYVGIDVQMIEPSHAGCKLVSETKKQFDMTTADFDVIERPFDQAMDYVNWGRVDTVIFCESIEHVEEEDFNRGFLKLEKHLFKNKGLLIILNWIDCHPLPIISRYHCRLVDDKLYDELSKNKKVIYRKNSHLILQY